MIYFYCRFLKVLVTTGVDVHHLLWIAVNQREPTALNLYHDPVAFFERVGDIIHGKFHIGNFPRYECSYGSIPVIPTKGGWRC